MWIVWGRRKTRRRQGYVADFCCICRAPRAFVLERIGSARHVYFVSAGQGDLVGFLRTCTDCGTLFPAKQETYTGIAKKALAIGELRKSTYSNFDTALRGRLELEKRIVDAPQSLTAKDRHALIKEPFVALSANVAQRFASGNIDLGIGLSVLGALALVIFGTPTVGKLFRNAPVGVLLLPAAAGIGLVAWQGLSSGRRFMKCKIYPMLARSLEVLGPNARELQAVLTELKQANLKIASKAKLSDLATFLRSGPSPVGLQGGGPAPAPAPIAPAKPQSAPQATAPRPPPVVPTPAPVPAPESEAVVAVMEHDPAVDGYVVTNHGGQRVGVLRLVPGQSLVQLKEKSGNVIVEFPHAAQQKVVVVKKGGRTTARVVAA
jgi:hypothetical protein